MPSLDCRYLECSRYALRIPSFHLLGKESIHQICLGGIDITLRKVLRRGGLSDKEVERTARLLDKEQDLDRLLSYQEVLGLKKELLELPYFWQAVFGHSRHAYETTAGYFREMGLLENVPFAIADSGWTGSLQQTLNLLLQSMGRTGNVTGYYFGLYELPKGVNTGDYHGYYFTPWGKIRRKVYFSNSLFECVFSAPKPMTMGYEKAGGHYRPVYENGPVQNRQALGMIEREVKRCAKKEAKRLPPQIRKWDLESPGRLAPKLGRFMGKPTREEALAFGKLKFTDDVLTGDGIIAAPLTESEIRGNHLLRKILVMLGFRKGVVRESGWMEGSIRQWGRHADRCLRANRRYRYALYLKKAIRNQKQRWEIKSK